MKIRDEFVIMSVMNNDVLVDTTGKYKGLIKLNGTSKEIVELLKQDKAKEEIIDIMFDKYDVDLETLNNDFDSLISSLKKVKALND